MSKNRVWYSTQESRDNGTTSILAIVETIFFVALTWGIAYYYDYYTHIYTAIAIAPFLLLRTPESTDKAIEWFFNTYQPDTNPNYKMLDYSIIMIISLLLSFAITYIFATEILIYYKNYELFFLSILLAAIIVSIGIGASELSGVGVTIKIGKEILVVLSLDKLVGATISLGIVVTVLGIVLSVTIGVVFEVIVGVMLGVVLGVILTGIINGVVVKRGINGRIVEAIYVNTIKNNFLKNFIFLFLAPILLIIGGIVGLTYLLKSILIKFIATTIYAISKPKTTFFIISKNWNEQISINDILYSPELLPSIHKKNKFFQLSGFISEFTQVNFTRKIMIFLLGLFWLLGYFYRFSIKSTAWFFFPLAYLANLNALQDEKQKNKAIKTQTWNKLLSFNIIISAVLFLYYKVPESFLKAFGFSEETINFIKIQVTHLHKYIIPEAMYFLIVAIVLYFILYLKIDGKEHIKDNKYHMFTFWTIRLIYSLWMVFLGWHIVLLTNQHVLPELPKIFGML